MARDIHFRRTTAILTLLAASLGGGVVRRADGLLSRGSAGERQCECCNSELLCLSFGSVGLICRHVGESNAGRSQRIYDSDHQG